MDLLMVHVVMTDYSVNNLLLSLNDGRVPSRVEVRPIEVKQIDEASYCNQVERELSTSDSLPWFSNIKRYSEDHKFPPNARRRDRWTI